MNAGHSMNIVIESIPHSEHRYSTCGDYWRDADGTLQIKVSELPDARHMLLVAIHELIEQSLCDSAGITNREIDVFDVHYAAAGEPGDDSNAPYYKQHQIATGVERILAAEMRVDWLVYEKAIDALGES